MNRRLFAFKGLAALTGAGISTNCSSISVPSVPTTPPTSTFPFSFSAWQDRKTTDKVSWGTAGQLGYYWDGDTLRGDGNGRVYSEVEAVEVRHRDAYVGYYPDQSWYIPNSNGAWPEGSHLLLKQDQRLIDSFKARCRSAHRRGLAVMIDWHGGGHDINFLLPKIAQLASEGVLFIANTNTRFEAVCAEHIEYAFMEIVIGGNPNYYTPASYISGTVDQWLAAGVTPLIEVQGDHPETQAIYNYAVSKGDSVGYRHSVDNNARDGNGNHIADHLPFNP